MFFNLEAEQDLNNDFQIYLILAPFLNKLFNISIGFCLLTDILFLNKLFNISGSTFLSDHISISHQTLATNQTNRLIVNDYQPTP
jgi:hypothetical protein